MPAFTQYIAILALVASCCNASPLAYQLRSVDTTTTPTSSASASSQTSLDNYGLAKLAGDHDRYFGVASRSADLDNPTYLKIMNSQFNAVTPEYEMKWSSIQPTQGNFDWTGADAVSF